MVCLIFNNDSLVQANSYATHNNRNNKNSNKTKVQITTDKQGITAADQNTTTLTSTKKGRSDLSLTRIIAD